MPSPKHLLIFRFSSLGDVAMTVPVLRVLLAQYTYLEVTVVSTAFVQPLFHNIERLHFYTADFKATHKGLPGLYRLFEELDDKVPFDAIADLHNVLRTKILRSFFRFSGRPSAAIDKGRSEKRAATRTTNKQLRPLKSTFQRYADVFAELGLPIELHILKGISSKPSVPIMMHGWKSNAYKVVGVAPFAQYKEKTYPIEKMKEVVRRLYSTPQISIVLFGSENDLRQIKDWKAEMNDLFFMHGSLTSDLPFIAYLDVMISMDSANMHLASMYGVPVVSVWGGTHPYLGFMGWGQRMDNAVQIDLPCRPSSVFGNKECPNNHQCMEGIHPLMIYEKVMAQLNAGNK